MNWRRSPEKKILETFFFFFFGEHLRLCPWSLALASRGSVLGKVVLGLGFFCVLGLGLEPCVLDSTSAKDFKMCPRGRPQGLHLGKFDYGVMVRYQNLTRKPELFRAA